MRFLLSVLASLFLTGGYSQSITKHTLASTYLDDFRELSVFLPESYPENGPYQVVYTFDADWLFELTWPNVNYLGGPTAELFPEAIVVGIHFGEDRNADMAIDWDEGTLEPPGQAFVQYVTDEVIPWVETNFRTSPFRTVMGHSNSSTFLDFFLLHPQGPVFNGYIALSQYHLPAVEKRLGQLLRQPPAKRIYYYLASGSQDAPYRLESGHRYTTLWDSLAQADHLNFHHAVYPLAEHMSVAPMGIPAGLRFVNQDYFTFGQMDQAAVEELRKPEFDAHLFWGSKLRQMEQLYGRPYTCTIEDAYVWCDVLPDRPDGLELLRLMEQRFLADMLENGEVQIVLGTAYGKLGELEQAERLFQAGIAQQDEPDFYSFFWPFQCYEQLGHYPEAARYADAGLALFPAGESTHARLLYQRAKLAAKYGFALEKGLLCMEAYRAYVDGGGRYTFIDPEWALFRHGQILTQLGDEEKAVQLYQQALELKPDFDPALEALK